MGGKIEGRIPPKSPFGQKSTGSCGNCGRSTGSGKGNIGITGTGSSYVHAWSGKIGFYTSGYGIASAGMNEKAVVCGVICGHRNCTVSRGGGSKRCVRIRAQEADIGLIKFCDRKPHMIIQISRAVGINTKCPYSRRRRHKTHKNQLISGG